jgi:hypothetical protein
MLTLVLRHALRGRHDAHPLHHAARIPNAKALLGKCPHPSPPPEGEGGSAQLRSAVRLAPSPTGEREQGRSRVKSEDVSGSARMAAAARAGRAGLAPAGAVQVLAQVVRGFHALLAPDQVDQHQVLFALLPHLWSAPSRAGPARSSARRWPSWSRRARGCRKEDHGRPRSLRVATGRRLDPSSCAKKKPLRIMDLQGLRVLVPERGIEPPTFALRMRCSTN